MLKRNKLIKIISALLFVLVLIPNAVHAEALQSKVSYEIPAKWKSLKSDTSDKLVEKLYHVRTDTIGSETHYSNALLQYYTLPATVTIAEADSIVASHIKGATHILSAQDGPNWKTYLFINYEGNQQYIVLYRIGIFDGVCVEFMLAFPHIADKDNNPSSVLTLNEEDVTDKKMAGIFCNQASVKEMVDTFNFVCEKLKIAKINQFKADVRIIDRPGDANFYRYKGPTNKDSN
jgi:hypothetical protein